MKKNAFTMIELIFVIVVLGILSGVAMTKYNSVQLDAKIASEKNTIGAVRYTIGIIHAKSEIKKGDFVAYTASPDGKGRVAMTVETTSKFYPISLSGENAPRADGTYHLTENEQLEIPNGINGSVLFVIMAYSSRAKFSTGKTFTAEGTEGRCDKNSLNCKQLVEGPATKSSGIPSTDKGFYELDSTGAWVYDAMNGTLNYAENKGDGTPLNISTNSSPDF